jgi:ABC-2 type transport system ATP-binding protein
MTAIQLRDVSKRFGSVRALTDVDLNVEDGEIYGFLGPNGAGKSTTLNIILDFIRPTSGSAQVFGIDCQENPKAVREHIGVLPEGYNVYERLSGRKHIEFAIESKDVRDDPEALLDRVGLTDAADRKAGGYSKGMKQRLVLSMALAGDPDLLLLDEPTTGLDPNGARKMREIIREENDRGATIFFSSHILSQVEAVCDRVGILREGEIVAEDDIASLQSQLGADTTLTVTLSKPADGVIDDVRALDGVSSVTADGDRVTINCDSGVKTRVLNTFEDAGIEVLDFSTEDPSLEQLFEAYTTGSSGVEA